MDVHPALLAEASKPLMFVVRHQRAGHRDPRTAVPPAKIRHGVDEAVEHRRAVRAAAAGCKHKRSLVEGDVRGPPG